MRRYSNSEDYRIGDTVRDNHSGEIGIVKKISNAAFSSANIYLTIYLVRKGYHKQILASSATILKRFKQDIQETASKVASSVKAAKPQDIRPATADIVEKKAKEDLGADYRGIYEEALRKGNPALLEEIEKRYRNRSMKGMTISQLYLNNLTHSDTVLDQLTQSILVQHEAIRFKKEEQNLSRNLLYRPHSYSLLDKRQALTIDIGRVWGKSSIKLLDQKDAETGLSLSKLLVEQLRSEGDYSHMFASLNTEPGDIFNHYLGKVKNSQRERVLQFQRMKRVLATIKESTYLSDRVKQELAWMKEILYASKGEKQLEDYRTFIANLEKALSMSPAGTPGSRISMLPSIGDLPGRETFIPKNRLAIVEAANVLSNRLANDLRVEKDKERAIRDLTLSFFHYSGDRRITSEEAFLQDEIGDQARKRKGILGDLTDEDYEKTIKAQREATDYIPLTPNQKVESFIKWHKSVHGTDPEIADISRHVFGNSKPKNKQKVAKILKGKSGLKPKSGETKNQMIRNLMEDPTNIEDVFIRARDNLVMGIKGDPLTREFELTPKTFQEVFSTAQDGLTVKLKVNQAHKEQILAIMMSKETEDIDKGIEFGVEIRRLRARIKQALQPGNEDPKLYKELKEELERLLSPDAATTQEIFHNDRIFKGRGRNYSVTEVFKSLNKQHRLFPENSLERPSLKFYTENRGEGDLLLSIYKDFLQERTIEEKEDFFQEIVVGIEQTLKSSQFNPSADFGTQEFENQLAHQVKLRISDTLRNLKGNTVSFSSSIGEGQTVEDLLRTLSTSNLNYKYVAEFTEEEIEKETKSLIREQSKRKKAIISKYNKSFNNIPNTLSEEEIRAEVSRISAIRDSELSKVSDWYNSSLLNVETILGRKKRSSFLRKLELEKETRWKYINEAYGNQGYIPIKIGGGNPDPFFARSGGGTTVGQIRTILEESGTELFELEEYNGLPHIVARDSSGKKFLISTKEVEGSWDKDFPVPKRKGVSIADTPLGAGTSNWQAQGGNPGLVIDESTGLAYLESEYGSMTLPENSFQRAGKVVSRESLGAEARLMRRDEVLPLYRASNTDSLLVSSMQGGPEAQFARLRELIEGNEEALILDIETYGPGWGRIGNIGITDREGEEVYDRSFAGWKKRRDKPIKVDTFDSQGNPVRGDILGSIGVTKEMDDAEIEMLLEANQLISGNNKKIIIFNENVDIGKMHERARKQARRLENEVRKKEKEINKTISDIRVRLSKLPKKDVSIAEEGLLHKISLAKQKLTQIAEDKSITDFVRNKRINRVNIEVSEMEIALSKLPRDVPFVAEQHLLEELEEAQKALANLSGDRSKIADLRRASSNFSQANNERAINLMFAESYVRDEGGLISLEDVGEDLRILEGRQGHTGIDDAKLTAEVLKKRGSLYLETNKSLTQVRAGDYVGKTFYSRATRTKDLNVTDIKTRLSNRYLRIEGIYALEQGHRVDLFDLNGKRFSQTFLDAGSLSLFLDNLSDASLVDNIEEEVVRTNTDLFHRRIYQLITGERKGAGDFLHRSIDYRFSYAQMSLEDLLEEKTRVFNNMSLPDRNKRLKFIEGIESDPRLGRQYSDNIRWYKQYQRYDKPFFDRIDEAMSKGRLTPQEAGLLIKKRSEELYGIGKREGGILRLEPENAKKPFFLASITPDLGESVNSYSIRVGKVRNTIYDLESFAINNFRRMSREGSISDPMGILRDAVGHLMSEDQMQEFFKGEVSSKRDLLRRELSNYLYKSNMEIFTKRGDEFVSRGRIVDLLKDSFQMDNSFSGGGVRKVAEALRNHLRTTYEGQKMTNKALQGDFGGVILSRWVEDRFTEAQLKSIEAYDNELLDPVSLAMSNKAREDIALKLNADSKEEIDKLRRFGKGIPKKFLRKYRGMNVEEVLEKEGEQGLVDLYNLFLRHRESDTGFLNEHQVIDIQKKLNWSNLSHKVNTITIGNLGEAGDVKFLYGQNMMTLKETFYSRKREEAQYMLDYANGNLDARLYTALDRFFGAQKSQAALGGNEPSAAKTMVAQANDNLREQESKGPSVARVAVEATDIWRKYSGNAKDLGTFLSGKGVGSADELSQKIAGMFKGKTWLVLGTSAAVLTYVGGKSKVRKREIVEDEPGSIEEPGKDAIISKIGTHKHKIVKATVRGTVDAVDSYNSIVDTVHSAIETHMTRKAKRTHVYIDNRENLDRRKANKIVTEELM